MKTQHAPGPWKVFGYEVGPSRRHLVATLYMQSGNSVGESAAAITKANAALIASAPSLLAQRDELRELLQYALDYPLATSTNEGFVTQARQALARTEGM